MKRLLLLIAILFGGTIVMRRLFTAERREGLSRLPATFMESCMDHMPEDSPPKAMMSGLRRIQEQNEELVALVREQNDLLRKGLGEEKAPPRARQRAKEASGPPSD